MAEVNVEDIRRSLERDAQNPEYVAKVREATREAQAYVAYVREGGDPGKWSEARKHSADPDEGKQS